MGISDLEQDLRVIKRAMELSSRYTNITARGYLCTGIIGLLGVYGTYLFLGKEKVKDMSLIAAGDVKTLIVLWSLIFVAAIGGVMFFSWRKARRNKISAWNSLAARMLFSQIPLIAIAGVFTVSLAIREYYSFIPGMWLGIYGVILYSFSYYTGIGHKIEGLLFIALGSIAVFTYDVVPLLLLGAGFGGIHLVSGFVRRLTREKGLHESEPTE